MKVMQRNRNLSGFTVIELIVVIVIVGILATIAVRAYGDAQNRATRNDLVSAAEQVKLKLNEYFTDKNAYPQTQAQVTTFLTAEGKTDLATKFGNATIYTYQGTAADGTACSAGGVKCEKYTITINKSAWKAPASESNVVISS